MWASAMNTRLLKILIDYSTSMVDREDLLERTIHEIVPHLKDLTNSSSAISLEYFSQDITALPDPLLWGQWTHEQVTSVIKNNRSPRGQANLPNAFERSLADLSKEVLKYDDLVDPVLVVITDNIAGLKLEAYDRSPFDKFNIFFCYYGLGAVQLYSVNHGIFRKISVFEVSDTRTDDEAFQASIDFLIGDDDVRRFQKFPRNIDIRISNLKEENAQERERAWQDRLLAKKAQRATIFSGWAAAVSCLVGVVSLGFLLFESQEKSLVTATPCECDLSELEAHVAEVGASLADLKIRSEDNARSLSSVEEEQVVLQERSLSNFEILANHSERLRDFEERQR